MMEDWQSDWEHEDTGRSTFNILPRVSTQPCYWKREEIFFFIGHVPFPLFLKRFNLTSTENYPCGNTNGAPLHYVAYIVTASFHMRSFQAFSITFKPTWGIFCALFVEVTAHLNYSVPHRRTSTLWRKEESS
ncbi:hypothetical protein AVEN_157484-1 [Araneus ventricosus]|uniref:Uncharacterized protein n=1 Tax=Araneus ventricosus TaxID=182803 RepID=A0A4Y2RPI2_ARAVE|nr:hypothetical protein AVEN_157484-1 [Araneus ventricosus]